jgi:hypothetical protein
MTQDQTGQAQGTGYVVRGEVVPDDETDTLETEQTGPMTRLRKVASAMRGDKPDQTVPDTTDPDSQDPNGSFAARTDEPVAMSDPVAEDEIDEEGYADAAPADDMSTVRIPETGSRDYWDDQHDTAPGGDIAATDPGPGIVSTATDPAGPGGTAPSAVYGSQADTTADVGAADVSAADVGAADVGEADVGEADVTEAGRTGKHAAAADAGLRPGEATDRLGDFGDIAFGNLLPDAAQYTAQWQQIQFRFVDDPQASVTEAADVLSQVTAKLEAAIQERQRAIEERQRAIQERASALRGRWGEGSNADTETLRETLRMYRAFMDQLIGSAS